MKCALQSLTFAVHLQVIRGCECHPPIWPAVQARESGAKEGVPAITKPHAHAPPACTYLHLSRSPCTDRSGIAMSKRVKSTPPTGTRSVSREARTVSPEVRAVSAGAWTDLLEAQSGPPETRPHSSEGGAPVSRINCVLPFFAPAELSALADYLERRVSARLERLARKREPRRDRRRRTRPPTRAGG